MDKDIQLAQESRAHKRLEFVAKTIKNEHDEEEIEEWHVNMIGFRVGDPPNENGYVFTEDATRNWLAEFSHPVVGRDGHTDDGGYQNTVIVWHKAEITDNNYVIFRGTALKIPEADKLRELHNIGVVLQSSIIVTVPHRRRGDITYDSESSTIYINRFVVNSLDFVLTPAETHTRILNDELSDDALSLYCHATLEGVDVNTIKAEHEYSILEQDNSDESESEDTEMTEKVHDQETDQKEMSALQQQVEDNKILDTVWDLVTDLDPAVQMQAARAIQQEFRRRREQYPDQPAVLLLESATEPALRKFRQANSEEEESKEEATESASLPMQAEVELPSQSQNDEIVVLRREVEDQKILSGVWSRITELPSKYHAQAYNAVKTEFESRRSAHPNADASLIMDAAYDNAVNPFREKSSKEILKEEFGSVPDGPTEAGTVIESDKPAILSTKTDFEKEFGRPEYHKPIVDMMSILMSDKKFANRFRSHSGGLLPTEVDMRHVSNAGVNWETTKMLGDAFENSRQGIDGNIGPTNRDLMIQEYQEWTDHGQDGSAMEVVMNSMQADQRAIYNLTTSDVAIPRTVSRMFIDIMYPMIGTMEMFDVRSLASTKDQLFIEDRTPVASVQETITMSGTLAADAEKDLGKRHFDLSKAYSMAGGVPNTQFALNPATGILRNIHTGQITLGNLTVYRYPFDFGEEASPPESKVTTEPTNVDMGWDGVKIRITHRAEVEAMANSGYPVIVRALMAASYDISDMIDRDLGQHVQFVYRYHIPSTQKYNHAGNATDNAVHYTEAYQMIGEACAKRADAGFSPERVFMNNVVYDRFSNLSLFDREKSPAAVLSPMNKIERLKGMTVAVSRRWDNNFIAIGRVPLAYYAVLASNPFTISPATNAKDANGNAIPVREWLCQICHWTGGPYKWEHEGLITSTTSKT